MKLLAMKVTRRNDSESLVSFLCGVSSLTFGLGALVLMISYMVGRPIGQREFFELEVVGMEVFNSAGSLVTVVPVTQVIPSPSLFGMLLVGTCVGGIGVWLGRRRSATRKATTSLAGLVVCSTAFVMGWILFLAAAVQ